MIRLGLTGSIGMGKSEAAKAFRAHGIPVFDSDATVHDLFANDQELVAMIEKIFPDCVADGVVNRTALGARVFGDENLLKKLEALVHPRVAQARHRFVNNQEAKGAQLVVFDVPLLFETGGEDLCDKTLVISAPADIQRSRVLSRDGMSEEKFNAILAKQMSDQEKRSKADYIISGADGLDRLSEDIGQLIAGLTKDV